MNLIFRKKTILNEFDTDIGSRVLYYAQKKGIKIFSKTFLKKIIKKNDKVIALTNKVSIKSDLLIYAIGRSPNTKNLNITNTKVKLDENNAIKVDRNSRSNDKTIFAIGDVTNRKNLTPVAIREAMILFDYLSNKKNNLKLDYNKVASAIFTQPEVGSIGYGEKDLKKLKIKYKVLSTEFSPLKYSFYKNQKGKVFIKILYCPKTEKVLGIIYIGESAAEIIQSLAISFQKNLYLKDLRQTIPVHPTSSEELVTII